MILIRSDANEIVGMGHVMRCLSIADAFCIVNEEIVFVVSDDRCSGFINDRGFQTIILNSDYSNMDDEPEWWNINSASLIIIDSYFVTPSYLSVLHNKTKTTCSKLVYIDDILAFPYSVDILVNYNAFSSEANYSSLYSDCNVDSPILILGPSYAPLRSMFKGIERNKQKQKVHNVLISTGGSDELHLSLFLIEYLMNHLSENDYVFHILIGALNSDRTNIHSLVQGNDRIITHESVVDMKSLISSMDIVISAAGSTAYEVCACGVPLILYSIADNQIKGAEAFDNLGLGINIGDLRNPETINKKIIGRTLKENAADLLFSELNKLSVNYDKRSKMGITMQNLIDGNGAHRLVNRLLF